MKREEKSHVAGSGDTEVGVYRNCKLGVSFLLQILYLVLFST